MCLYVCVCLCVFVYMCMCVCVCVHGHVIIYLPVDFLFAWFKVRCGIGLPLHHHVVLCVWSLGAGVNCPSKNGHPKSKSNGGIIPTSS